MTLLDIHDEGLLDLVDANQRLEALVDRLSYAEGLVWDDAEDRLVFSDIPANRIHSWSEKSGLQLWREPSNMANGNFLARDGALLTCEHATSRVVRQVARREPEVIASHYRGRELNSPNDIVERSDGLIYFTDPTYGRQPWAGLPRPLELDFRALFRLDPISGELTALADDFVQPNGLCFSPDETWLFVNDSERYHIRRFRVAADGSVSDGDVWAHTEGRLQGSPDGMKVDILGNIYCCAQGGVQVFSADAACLGTILTTDEAGNIAFGGHDMRTLFIGASSRLLRLRVKVPAQRWSGVR